MDTNTTETILWQVLAALNFITIPAALYYFYRCRILEDGVFKAFHVIKHYHAGYYRMAHLSQTLRTYTKGLVRRINNLNRHQGDSDATHIA